MTKPAISNEDQIAYWNGPTAERWSQYQDALDRALEPIGHAAQDRAAVTSGERIVDVGCGCGATSLALGAAIGEAGAVLGVDISSRMLARARERALERGLARLTFVEADASAHRFEPIWDLVFSRFGVMFFDDPTAAFANLRGALRPGGRLAFACWRPATENPWMRVPVEAASSVVTPPEPTPPGAPGPFAFADPVRVTSVLAGAGFADVSIEPGDHELPIAATLEEAVAFAADAGPAARLLMGADDATTARARSAIRAALAPYQTPRGVVMPAATWIVTARS